MVNMVWGKYKCPSCGLGSEGTVRTFSSPTPAEDLDWEAVKSFFIGFRKKQIFFSYLRCQNCSQLYCPEYFTERQLSDLYSDMPDNLIGQGEKAPRITQEGYASWASRKVPTASRYLELGPDIGLLASAIGKRIPLEIAAFVEPNLKVHQQLLASLSDEIEKEISVSLDGIRGSNFDLVSLIHVLDHLLDPKKVLLTLHSITDDKASILIVVHNEDSLLRKIVGHRWPPFCLQHPLLFKRSSLSKLLIETGWQIKDISSSRNYYFLPELARICCSVLGIPKYWTKAIPNLKVSIKTGNMIALATKIPRSEI
jgi:hypothetical protein